MTPRPTIICSECHARYALNIIQLQQSVGVIEVGHQCPVCRFFTHSFYTNPALQEKQAKLARYRQAARRGPKFLARYEKARQEYQREHDDFNGRIGAQRLDALAATIRLGQGEVRVR